MTPEEQKEDLVRYLQDAHGMEQQSLQTLQAAVKVAGDPQLESLYQGHVMETQTHLELLNERLEAHGASRSLTKDLGGRLTAVVHGLGTGTDSGSAWLIAIDAVCVMAVGIAVATRLRTPVPDPIGGARTSFRQRVQRRASP